MEKARERRPSNLHVASGDASSERPKRRRDPHLDSLSIKDFWRLVNEMMAMSNMDYIVLLSIVRELRHERTEKLVKKLKLEASKQERK